MKFSHLFVDRPIFAAVISIVITLIGAIAYLSLPVAQYPEVAPPTIVVTATYPGASAQIVSETVATPIEQEVNGVENMLYMLSQSTDDGRLSLTVTFALGTDLDEVQVQVQAVSRSPSRGIGQGVGFKLYVQDRAGQGLQALREATYAMMFAAAERPDLRQVFTLYETDTPRLWLDIDRVRAEMLGVPLTNVFEALSTYLGSAFVNDFNNLGRTYRVTAQADAGYRLDPEAIGRLRTRNAAGEMVPLGSVVRTEFRSGPSRVPRDNLYPAAELQGAPAPGVSSGEALDAMEALAADRLPQGFAFERTELAYQERTQGNTAALVFALSVVFVFLVLAAQYESWMLPLAVILIVPMCPLFAITGVALRGMDNNILTQVGLIVLVGLAAKNAILIVEFPKEGEEREGLDRFRAVVATARVRLRPILMTSFAFILGVVPLVIASGAGAEMRRVLGTTVFSGMLGVTLLGLLLTPVFDVLCRWPAGPVPPPAAAPPGAAPQAG